MLIHELHGHHQIEDTQYFPTLAGLDKTAAQGFDLLDADHQSLDQLLHDLAEGANRVLRGCDTAAAFTDASGALHKQITGFKPLLNRHLTDEEELVVPVLLKHSPPEFG
jgi:hemerythrin-like domain-containing protein